MMKSVLLRWKPSLNNRSKLKLKVKSGCVTSVGPSLNPHSLSQKQKSRATVPLTCSFFIYSADKYVREVVNEGGEDDEIVDSDGEVICNF